MYNSSTEKKLGCPGAVGEVIIEPGRAQSFLDFDDVFGDGERWSRRCPGDGHELLVNEFDPCVGAILIKGDSVNYNLCFAIVNGNYAEPSCTVNGRSFEEHNRE